MVPIWLLPSASTVLIFEAGLSLAKRPTPIQHHRIITYNQYNDFDDINLPVMVVMDTDAEPESGRTISSAMHSTLLKQTGGVDFILKVVSEPALDSNICTPVELQ